MYLTDRSNGFWGDLFIRRLNPRIALTQRFGPNAELMGLLAKEAISSIRGSTKHKIVVIRTGSEPLVGPARTQYHVFSVGRYPFGMLSNTTASGVPLKPLSKATLRKREFEAQFTGKPARGAEFILRETSEHIYNGLKVLKVTENGFDIGWEGKDAELVLKHEHGFIAEDKMFKYSRFGHKESSIGPGLKVPPRKIRGYQVAFLENVAETLRRLVNPNY